MTAQGAERGSVDAVSKERDQYREALEQIAAAEHRPLCFAFPISTATRIARKALGRNA